VKLTKTRRVIIPIVIAMGITATVYLVVITWARRQSSENFDRAYEAIKVGDSRDAVVAALGKPDEVTNCPTYAGAPKMNAEFRTKCFQQYEYFSFMARRTIYFDQNGVVINKTIAVSP
jgi:hypothetical protein